MNNFYKILFTQSLIMGTLIAISSYSWMSMWIGLEINLISMIPLLSSTKNIYPSEAAMKYFITQAMASSILLLSIIMSLNFNEFPQSLNNYLMMIMNSALLTKMGAAPFHFWFPEVMEGLNWMNSLLMLTWQKIAPFVLIMINSKMTLFISIIIIITSMIGGIAGLNQTSMRKIMAFSSINHIGWMLASTLNSQSIWIIYFSVYSIISINLILIFKSLNIFMLSQFFNSSNSNKMIKFFFILNFLSLGGLPPFLGFFPKWLTINNLILNNFFTLSLILIISTLITLYFYLRISFSSLTINSSESKIKSSTPKMFMIICSNFVTISGLIFCTMMFISF
uniref:NADH-ubiquinone oxidoreductase chain 2 n=1 Tax=Deporaus marginatus TaxID=1544439 RepID=A0A7G7WQ72_9CUCU|nr:NADH dehydrogenase subunit 2 [Deporaus marginatus]QNH68699.1 NADH dehydrogenase subunit 2 [Deporaus marginatus]